MKYSNGFLPVFFVSCIFYVLHPKSLTFHF